MISSALNISELNIHERPMQKIGVIGGGQLAWMMGKEATNLGLSLLIQTPSLNDPAVAIASETIIAKIDDAQATAALGRKCDVITFENEFIDLVALLPISEKLAKQGVFFRPSLQVLAPLLDKYDQLAFLEKLGVPTPHFSHNLDDFADHFPCVVKTRRHGYDGYGTFIIKNPEDLSTVLNNLGDRPLVWQEFINFTQELAIIACRSVSGEIKIYPIVETQQKNQVCHRVIAPAHIPNNVVTEAEAIACKILEGLDVVGVLGIELFLTADDRILVNEIAPRTHNSGHFTLDACITSQFSQLLRASAGLELGETNLKSDGAVMVNLLGYEIAENDYAEKRQQLANIPNAHVWWYGKSQARPGRKLGHVTVLLTGENTAIIKSQAEAIAQEIEKIWYFSTK
jgi:5-(carboxyamino)imidazole ribonucleotide synthase